MTEERPWWVHTKRGAWHVVDLTDEHVVETLCGRDLPHREVVEHWEGKMPPVLQKGKRRNVCLNCLGRLPDEKEPGR